MKKLCGTLFLLLLANFAFAQIQKPVNWTAAVKNKKELVFTAYIENGWHIYDLGVSDFGPNPTEFSFEKVNGAQLSGEVISSSPSITVYEELFGMETKYFEGTPKFSQAFKLLDTDGFQIDGYITYSACTKKRCVNLTEEFSFTPEDLISGGIKKLGNENIAAAAPPQETEIKNDLWRPVINELNAFSPQNAAGTSWAGIFLICFGGGFVALLMPCIWPVIPLTVSFFLKHFNKSREKAIAHASFYGISILVIYLVLGLFFTLFFGASALNSLATNAAVNLFFFALLIFFAISFFGLFEIRLPAAWINKINGRAQAATGLLGIFFMAFTLVLVSFSCTGPIIGTLLVQLTTTGNILAPAVGMCGFGLALAIPFTLFAFFPSLMQKMPKSGEWLNTLKIVLGFLELALALK
ncbi:MAG: thiol:disulfide interchange protein, partial [Elusimicrobiota bacterium]|nr:thiol:disulfide interchange protein [Elusimicrobiota bacterium]